jgi:hypothetical protein
MTRIERVTSPLPRECSATELHGLNLNLGVSIRFLGAGEGNRTLVISLEGFCSTIELHPPAPLRNFTCPSPRLRFPDIASARRQFARIAGGGGWIRTNVGARPTDLQSAPFSRSGTPPAEPEILRLIRRLVNKIAGIPALRRGRSEAWHYHGRKRGYTACASPSSKTTRTSWPSSSAG